MKKPFECPLENDVTAKEKRTIEAIIKGKPWYCSYPQHPMFMSWNYIKKKGCLTKDNGRKCRYLRKVL